jgi:hypothetical protein
MNGKTILTVVGTAALVSAAPVLSQGRSGGTPGAAAASNSRAGGMGAGMGAGGAGPASPNGVGAGSLLTGIDRATEATSGNANATAGFTNAMDLRAAAQVRRNNARANSQGCANASATGIANANADNGLCATGTTTTSTTPRRRR